MKGEIVNISVIGAGGTGGWFGELLAKYLVQNIYVPEQRSYIVNIIDNDVIEQKNLVRQHFIGSESLGLSKADYLRSKMDRIVSGALVYASLNNLQDLVKVHSFTDKAVPLTNENIDLLDPDGPRDDSRRGRVRTPLRGILVNSVREMVNEESLVRTPPNFNLGVEAASEVPLRDVLLGNVVNYLGGSRSDGGGLSRYSKSNVENSHVINIVVNLVDNNYTRNLIEDWFIHGRKDKLISSTSSSILFAQVVNIMINNAIHTGSLKSDDKIVAMPLISKLKDESESDAIALCLAKVSDDTGEVTIIDSLVMARPAAVKITEEGCYAISPGGASDGERDYLEAFEAKVADLAAFSAYKSSDKEAVRTMRSYRHELIYGDLLPIKDTPDGDGDIRPAYGTDRTVHGYIDSGNSDKVIMTSSALYPMPYMDYRNDVYASNMSLPDGMMSCADRGGSPSVAQTSTMNVASAVTSMKMIEAILNKVTSMSEVLYRNFMAESAEMDGDDYDASNRVIGVGDDVIPINDIDSRLRHSIVLAGVRLQNVELYVSPDSQKDLIEKLMVYGLCEEGRPGIPVEGSAAIAGATVEYALREHRNMCDFLKLRGTAQALHTDLNKYLAEVSSDDTEKYLNVWADVAVKHLEKGKITVINEME